ncbi:hypothetical protein OIU79_022303 [Salix purpurea]|uniref:Uncharacterized protein n=1 Tax=Salix purpurea TaxID=77065 RepID=A0A9Q1ACT0_SALPP|nr:hypothetical protein OIU79_022303 [Salix purpurea]
MVAAFLFASMATGSLLPEAGSPPIDLRKTRFSQSKAVMGRERSSWCSEKRSPLCASAPLSLCTTSISTAGSPDSLLQSLLQSTSLCCSDATRNIPLKCECSSDPVQRGKNPWL